MKVTRLARTLAALAVMVCSQAHAEAPSWYAGAGATWTRANGVQDLCDDLSAFGVAISNCQETAWGGGAFVGARFNRYLALEGSLGYFGKFEATAVGAGGTATVKWDGYGGTLQALGILPINEEFEVYLRGGGAFWYVDASVEANSTQLLSDSATGFSPVAGLGLNWYFANRVGLRLEFQQMWSVGDDTKTGESDLQTVFLGVIWRF